MTPDPVSRLAALQADDGSFPSLIQAHGDTVEDHNGFTTAMVLRALRGIPGEPSLDLLRSRALTFIERCRSRSVTGAFCFWPEDARPAWAHALPPDIDDTAIMAVELMRHGRLSQRDGLRTACGVLLRRRLVIRSDELRPPWIADGAFLTWIGTSLRPNIVDCCVNANAVALMAYVRATHLPGYQQAVRTIIEGLRWAGDDPARLRSLTPFYPSIADLHDAVEHAVECGANELGPALSRLQSIVSQGVDTNRGCCSSGYGATTWHCPALLEALGLRRAITLPAVS